jgi:outer membrane protein insertion porin family
VNSLKPLLLLTILLFSGATAVAQTLDLSQPKEYSIGGITVLGADNTDVQAIKLFAGLKEGDRLTIPGDRIPKAIKNLWDQNLFADVSIGASDVRGESVFLVIEVEERDRLRKFGFVGVSKSEGDNLKDEVPFGRGRIVNDNMKSNAVNATRKYFIEKGYIYCKVDIEEKQDSLLNSVNFVVLNILVDKGVRVKNNDIDFHGNEHFSDKRLRKFMKNTKEKRPYRLFKRSKYVKSEFKEDKERILAKYNEDGYRNAKILSDSISRHDSKTIDLDINVKEGQQFYFGEITWLGNTKYDTEKLENRLGIVKGEVYNRVKLEERLFMSQNADDVSSLYLDNGYLSFSANPVETRVYNDTIDVEVRIYEGKQYRINNIIIKGNTITNDHVIMREIRTRPGDLFSRSDIIRTQRELANLAFFDPAATGINPIQNPADGTVDIEYTVAEKPSDQIELQGGWGAGRVVGTLGLSFNNFSMRSLFKKGAWRPVPKGDGQKLSLRAQTNGQFYSAYSVSFLEPWLGGRKPNSFSVSLQRSQQSNGAARTITNSEGEPIVNPNRQELLILGGSVGLGKRLTIPDDWFQFYASLSYQNYRIQNFGSIFTFADGRSNNLALTGSLVRDSKFGNPIFPSRGSSMGLTVKFTPAGLFWDGNRDFSNSSDQEKFEWVQYHKWKFTTEWYTPLGARDEEENNRLVLFSKVGLGYLGNYNSTVGDSPFERFYLGGSALTGFQLDGREIIALRGYDDLSLSPQTGATFINKYTMELRYLLSPNPSATIYGLGFLEAGNTWNDFTEYQPLTVKRSGGVGLRIFLPMFGLMGLDYGWRFDDVTGAPNMANGQFHFTIGMNLGEL